MTFYWHDYETLGPDVRTDRPAQFAGLRTDDQLEPVGEPLVLYCRVAPDYLPDPTSCLIHGLTPDVLKRRGLSEQEFARRIHRELAKPGTCSVGYNAVQFDHEITRYLFYRNLIEPYDWQWQNGNSRWDIIDLLRAAYAFRPAGIEWPRREDGAPSFRLEDLACANNIESGHAHDALSDVLMTVALARLVKETQPRLFDYYFRLRDKNETAALIDVDGLRPFVFVSSFIPAERGCATLVAPLGGHPSIPGAFVVYDLRHDPAEFLDLSPDALRDFLFSPTGSLPDGTRRPPLHVVYTTRCPFVASAAILDDSAQDRLSLNLDKCRRHLRVLRSNAEFRRAAASAFERTPWPSNGEEDVDGALYSGFIGDRDRSLLRCILNADPASLPSQWPNFKDARLPELFFRYRARNHPETLSKEEEARWLAYRRRRLILAHTQGRSRLGTYRAQIEALRLERSEDPVALSVLDQLVEYGANLEMALHRVSVE